MGTESDNSQLQGQGRNPAWDEFYNAIPEDYREDVQPHIDPVLQKWDQGVQKQFEAYNPYKKYVDEKVDPQVMDYAMNLLDTLNDNDGALQVYGQLENYLKQQGLIGQEEDKRPQQQPQQQAEEEEVNWNDLPPALKKQIEQLQQMTSMLAEERIDDRRTRQQAQEDAALEAELKTLKDKHGEYDEDWVLAKMVNGMDAEDAVKSYHQLVDQIAQNRNRPQPGFKALGAGSGEFPSGNGQFDPRKASSRDVSRHIAERLMDLNRDR